MTAFGNYFMQNIPFSILFTVNIKNLLMKKQLFLLLICGFLLNSYVNSQTAIGSNLSNPKGLVIKEDNAYFFESGVIKKIDLNNPTSTTTVFSGFSAQAIPSTLEPSNDGFFYPETGQAKVWKVVTTGANETLTNNFISGTGGRIGFAFQNDIGDTFFTREMIGSTTATELRIRLGSSNSSQVIKNIPNSYLNILDVAAFGNTFYFSTNNGRVWRVGRYNNIATQAIINIGQNNVISGIEVTQDYLYYVDITNDKVVRVLRSNGTGAVDLFSGLGITSIDIKDNIVYGISSSNLYEYTDPDLPLLCNSIVNIPDANFKAALLDHGIGITGTGISVIDTDGDGEICINEASAYTGTIYVANKNISDLTGIEAFSAVTDLNCDNNNLTSLNVSSNTNLQILNFEANQITSIDVSNNSALRGLISTNNALTNLDVSNNPNLTDLSCGGNSLSALDLSNNTMLSTLVCNNNQLSSLDLSSNPDLSIFICQSNQLTELDVANGNNTTIATLIATANPNLACIQHDSNFDPTTNSSWVKDTTASWSTNCSVSSCNTIVNIPDANFKAALLDHGAGIVGSGISIIDTDGDGEICITEAQAYTGIIDVHNKNISDITGIEAFTALTQLWCNNNALSTLDVSQNTALTHLFCYSNALTTLDVSQNTALTDFRCFSNQITSLDVSQNSALLTVYCQTNALTALNLANGNNGINVGELLNVNATGNSNLNCIQHDNGYDPATNPNWIKDATANWSDNCASLSIVDFNTKEDVKLYPNPTTSTLTITSVNGLESATIYSVLGKEILRSNISTIDVSLLKSGVYFISIKSNSGRTHTKRFIKN